MEELERKQSEPGFWDNPEVSQKIVQEAGSYKNTLDEFDAMQGAYDDALVMMEMAEEEDDESLIPEIREQIDLFKELHEKLRISTLLSGEFDHKSAILTLHAGAGGTEACDWTGMLYRMYTRWAEAQGYKVDLLDYQEGDEAGIKSVTFEVSGEYAYGFLKSERGVHRLVRISPFDSNARRQTSFSSLDVAPVIEDDGAIEIKMEDLRIDTYRASGAGGQHVNRTDSAVRIVHNPTGIVVQCQNERSQVQNKEMCFRMLRAKLAELKEQERMQQMADVKGEMKKIEWGSQIRSYVFQPYTLVKDLRTGYEVGDINSVMDGNLEGFVTSFLQMSTRPAENQ